MACFLFLLENEFSIALNFLKEHWSSQLSFVEGLLLTGDWHNLEKLESIECCANHANRRVHLQLFSCLITFI